MKRISFNVNEKVYEKLNKMIADQDGDNTLSAAVKTMLYAIAQEPLELSQKEIDRLETVRKRKEELARLERELTAPREVPKIPFDKNKQVSPHTIKEQQKPQAPKPQNNGLPIKKK